MLDLTIPQDDSWPVNSWETLMSLPLVLQRGLTAVSIFALLSLVLSTVLATYLAYYLIKWKRGTHSRLNQFVVLIFNLLLADLQQSTAFVLNAQWVRLGAIIVDTNTCFAQGWFVSTGDLASGVFTFAMAMHCFADIVYDFRLTHTRFILAIIGLWTFIYSCAIIGLAMHPDDFYMRAGAWCWVNAKYINERLYLHYFWVIIAEFGTLIIYLIIFIVIQKRIRSGFYETSEMQYRAQTAAKLVVVYPLVYVVCTLPLVIARLKTMAGTPVSFLELCIAGAMITSNGWLDVLLYSITRRALIFGPSLTSENVRALDTFLDSNANDSNWRADSMFGNTTIIEATRPESCHHSSHRKPSTSSIPTIRPSHHFKRMHSAGGRSFSILPVHIFKTCSLEDLHDGDVEEIAEGTVKTETVVEVTRSESMAILPVPFDCVAGRVDESDHKLRTSFEMSTSSISRASEPIFPCTNPKPAPWEEVVLGEWPAQEESDDGRR